MNLIGKGSGSLHDCLEWAQEIVLKLVVWQFTLFKVFYRKLTKRVQSKSSDRF